MLTIEQQIERNAQRMPEKVALICKDTRVSYGELWERCCEAAKTLQNDAGFYKGKRVVLAAAGNAEFVYQYFGTHLAGGICVPIDPDTKPARREYIERIVATGAPSDGMADIMFTTGTTGAPKGVVLTHENIAASARNINAYIGNDADDVELLALPVSHSFGLGRLRCVLSKGGTMVLLGTFANVKRFFAAMEEHHVTGFGMVPAGWAYLKMMSRDKIRNYAGQLKYIEIGSSFMSVEDKKMLMEWLPNTRICMHYGLTEASRSAFMEFHEYAENLSSIGKAAPNVDIRIIDGEICVKGEHVTQRYWNESPKRIAQDFHDGYFRTGDSGWMDEDGHIYIKGRIKEIINVGGEKVSPMEVEDVLNAIPQIKESACCAMPDMVMGEVVEAFIVEKEPVTDAEIKEIIKPQLENYKWPKRIVRVDAIPKTSSGKIQRLQLKEV
ncbi:MAG: acyl--CoA ligase [Paludibacteraceae bacterium]|nr:acyl--CoA ligase [Paludibacteraceae bacterium]